VLDFGLYLDCVASKAGSLITREAFRRERLRPNQSMVTGIHLVGLTETAIENKSLRAIVVPSAIRMEFLSNTSLETYRCHQPAEIISILLQNFPSTFTWILQGSMQFEGRSVH
jgi:hypothetical protein